MAFCPSCGKKNAEDARFCSACGTALESVAPTRERRKTVTVVFCDLTGSTSMGERLDSESLRQVMALYSTAMRSALERHGGTVEKFIGDAVMAVFGVPKLYEDDALRAVRAAADMRAALAELNEELRERWDTELQTRTGVNTGEVVAGDPSGGESFVVGDTVNVAARLEQAAPAGEILLGEQTYHLVRDAVSVEAVEPLTLKGKADSVPAYRLVDVARYGSGVARRLDSPLVGREVELGRLEEAFQRAVEDQTCELVTVLGLAGAGKSRLAHELTARVSNRASVLSGRCLPYGEGITFWPLAEVVRQAATIDEDETAEEARAKIAGLLPDDSGQRGIANHIASAVGLSTAASTPEETFYATRKLFERLATERPLVVLFDDLHWAEPTFLDLLEYLKGYCRDRPVLVILLARPELREARPALAGSDGPPTVVLEPLGEAESELLIGNLLGQARLAEEVAERISQAAQGNPLYVEEWLRMLVDEGLLEKRDGRWSAVADLSDISIPPTIQALLDARIDRLTAQERGVIEPAAVIGQEFWRGAVVELAPEALGQEIDVHLAALLDKELIRHEDATTFPGEAAFLFAHILVRDAGYAGLLKEARSELHRDFAGWLERRVGKRIAEYEEIVGYHLEQAFRYREQLAPLDEDGRDLGRRAAERLGAAADRARGRGDMPAAAKLFERAVSVLERGEPARLELLLKLALVLSEVGEIARANALFDEAATTARAAGDRRLEMLAVMERAYWRLGGAAGWDLEELRQVATKSIEVFEELGDEGSLARAWEHLAWVDSAACRWGAVKQSLDRGLLHARRAGDAHLEGELLFWLTGVLHYGPTPVEEGIRQLKEMLGSAEAHAGATTMLGFSDRAVAEAAGLAGLEAMRGDFKEARLLCSRAKAVLEELGQPLKLAVLRQASGWIELLAEAPVDAERELGWSLEKLKEIGDKWYVATSAALLAEAAYAQERWTEAEELTSETEHFAAADDVVSHILWRATRGKLLARRDELRRGEDLVREAIALSRDTDDINIQADKLSDLAEVLGIAGRGGEIEPVLSEALELYERKGNLVSGPRMRRLLDQLVAEAK